MEVKFFFRATVAGITENLGLGFMYSPVHEELRNLTHSAINVVTSSNSLAVVKVDSIHSVVAMIPFKRNGGDRDYFLVEKFALGVINSNDPVHSEQ
jgi:hypothetical protein